MPAGKIAARTAGRLAENWASEYAGVLSMTIGLRGDRCIATKQYHRGALRIIRPHYLDATPQVSYVVVNPGGAYLGGDDYAIDVDLDAESSLLLTTQSATKIYRTPGNRARQDMKLRLGPGSVLEYMPDQLIAYRGASYTQHTVVEMDSTAQLVMAEVITPGWSPDGKLFKYDQVRLRTDIYVDGVLRVLDNLMITPGQGSPVDGMAFMEKYTHVGSLLVMDARVDAALVDELHQLLTPLDPDGQFGITLLDGPGFVVRALSHSTEALDALIRAAVDLLRGRWRGQGPLNLRKY